MSGEPRLSVLFFTTTLGGGGAERHLLRVANHLNRQQFEVAIATTRAGGSYETEVSPDIKVHTLGAKRIRSLKLLKLRQLLTSVQPDLICSVMDIPTVLAASAYLGKANKPILIGSVQAPPSIYLRKLGWPGLVLRLVLPAAYSRTAHLIALSEGVSKDVIKLSATTKDRVSVIYNAGYDEQMLEQASEKVDGPIDSGPIIVGCGRLTEQKGFTHLIRALPAVREHFPACLWLIGDGELRDQLEQEAFALGVGEFVWFAGFQTNPFAFMQRADLFVLSSLYEGFGNVLVEAMSLGTPVISTACPFGPDEIITHGESGLLVPPRDPESLSRAIIDLLANPTKRQELAHAGHLRAERFSAAKIAQEYGDLFYVLANRLHSETAR